MSFLAFPPNQARKPFAEVLPDGRKRLTSWFKATTTGEFPQELMGAAYAVNTAHPWTDAPTGWTGLRLTYKQMDDTLGPKGADTQPMVRVIWEQIPQNDRVMVGLPAVSVNQYKFTEVVVDYVQFSNGSTSYSGVDIVGSATAPSPYTTAILKTVDGVDDGTLRRYKLTYTTGGEMADVSELRFGGKLTIRTLKYLNMVPPTPSGYTLVGPGVEFINGLPLYSYQFAKADNGSGSGTGGQISQGFTNSQGGDIAFDPTNPDGATGEVICTTRYITTPAITANPITQPTSFVLFALDVEDEAGYRLWTSRSGFGGGSSISVNVDGQPDGALIYTVTQNDDDGTTVPAYPGSGTAYNVKLTHTRDNGFWRNVAIWQKPPATVTFQKGHNFYMPGRAYFNVSPDELIQQPPVDMMLLADYEVSYNTSQISDVPFTVEAWGYISGYFTPTGGSIQPIGKGLGGYLAQASGVNSATAATYNNIPCDEYDVQLISSIPSTFPTGATVIGTDNDPYLVDVSGTIVYRRTKISYTF